MKNYLLFLQICLSSLSFLRAQEPIMDEDVFPVLIQSQDLDCPLGIVEFASAHTKINLIQMGIGIIGYEYYDQIMDFLIHKCGIDNQSLGVIEHHCGKNVIIQSYPSNKLGMSGGHFLEGREGP